MSPRAPDHRPFFYAVAVPAVLLVGISKSGFGTGFGSLAVPLMALALPVRLLQPPHPPHADAPAPRHWLGRVLAAASGFTSFVAHAGGPPIGFDMLPLKLAPLQFSATMAVFFAAINAAKWLPYAWLGLIDASGLLTSFILAPLAPLGVWLGVRIVKVVPQALFYRLVHTGLALTGAKLLWDGLRAG